VRASSDLEKAEAKEREGHGIPLDPVTWQEFQTLGERVGLRAACAAPPMRGLLVFSAISDGTQS